MVEEMIIKYQKGSPIEDSLKLSLIDKALISKQVTVHHSEVTKFARRCVIITKEELAKEISTAINGKPLFYKKNEYIQATPNLAYMITDEWSWASCLLFYVLFNSTAREQDYNRTKKFIERYRLNLQVIFSEVYRHAKNLDELYGQLQNGQIFFNTELFIKELRRQKVKYSLSDNKLLVFFNNVTIADDNAELRYKEVIVKIEEWKVLGFALRFEHFDYFSSSHQPVYLHPFLHPTRMPYFSNDILYWCIPDYKLYIESLTNLVYAKDINMGQSVSTLANISTVYNDLRKLWNNLRVTYRTRAELSDRIFKYYLK
jgi:hypothetical protein